MSGRPILSTSLVERAFEMARSGEYATVSDIIKALKREGFTGNSLELHLSGRGIRQQLRDACRAAHGG